MNFLEKIRRAARAPVEIKQLLSELVEGVDNETRVINQRQSEIIDGLKGVSSLLSDGQKQNEVIAGLKNLSVSLNDRLQEVVRLQTAQLAVQNRQVELLEALVKGTSVAAVASATLQKPPSDGSFASAMQAMPLLIDERTYNTSHPDYNADAVRNFPGLILNSQKPSRNVVFEELKKLAKEAKVSDDVWPAILGEMLEESQTVPHAEVVLERRAAIEQYLADLGRKYHAHYVPGWVNLDDALFLYWLVRRLKPETIVQTGVCNGLSSAFMMLALAKNGPTGKLHVIDLAPVFDPNDPAWTVKGKVYGVVIPEGKSSGWIVPEAYADRFEVWNGDAKLLLPKMVDKLDSIDMFYHDSDHTYNHMMFEFREAKRKLRPGGLVVGDDISWNSSVWDFADEQGVPSYNFKGAVGVAFM